MKRILFFAHVYWELHWMYNVIRALDGVVYSDSPQVVDLCHQWGVTTTDDYANYQILVTTNMHMGQNWDMCQYFLTTGGQTVIMQHAWDAGVSLDANFWNHDMSKFSHYVVGCTQDEQWLSAKYGPERIHNLGMPKLDDLYRVKHDSSSLEDIYQLVGQNNFYLSVSPSNTISEGVCRAYSELLVPQSPVPIVFKVHPGNQEIEAIRQGFADRGLNYTIVGDDITNRDFIYRLIKASQAVVCVESFLSIEASLLGKPVIFWGHGDLPSDFYNRAENINQIHRAPVAMASDLGHPHFQPMQQTIAENYLCDGQNTNRVVQFLKTIT